MTWHLPAKWSTPFRWDLKRAPRHWPTRFLSSPPALQRPPAISRCGRGHTAAAWADRGALVKRTRQHSLHGVRGGWALGGGARGGWALGSPRPPGVHCDGNMRQGQALGPVGTVQTASSSRETWPWSRTTVSVPENIPSRFRQEGRAEASTDSPGVEQGMQLPISGDHSGVP